MTHPRASAAHGSSVRYWGVLWLLVASLAFAQGKPSYTTPGVWKAWDWDFENGGPTGRAATRAEVKALADTVMELRALLMASPVVAKPVGFNAMLGGHFNGPGCRPVIRPNWDYFDRSLPRSAVQLITIQNRCVDSKKSASDPDPAGCPTNNALLESLDWNKVRALMDR